MESENIQPEWLLKYDQFYFAELPKKKKNDKHAFSNFVKFVKPILVRGWNERVEEFEIYNAGINPSTKNQRALIGVKLTADWDRSVTKGPEANTPAATEFRKFYEAVVWYNAENPGNSKKQILVTIANYVLAKHYAPINIQFRHFNWDKLVTEASEYTKCSTAFEKLASAIRDIKGFPLAVSTIYCTSPFYRRTEPFPPLGKFLFTNSKASQVQDDSIARITLEFEGDDPMDGTETTRAATIKRAPYFTPALSVMLTMEHSNKFGDTPQIIAKFKTAFYIELAQRLKDDHKIFAVSTEKNLFVTIVRITLEFEGDDPMDGTETTRAATIKRAPYFTPALSVMLTMEHSNKFGDTPQIIAKFKTAFYIELAQRLKDDHKIFAVSTEKNLFVTINDIAFDVEIGQTKEIAIAKRLENENRHNMIPIGGDWKSLKHKIEFLPQMCNHITGLTHRFSAFAETCQLFKKFLASHFLLEHFDDIAVELIVANVFLALDEQRGNPPLDPFSGFTHILHLLTSHDFAKQPLFIDFNGNLDSEKKETMLKHFANARPVLPPLILFTSDDESGIRFTKTGPEMIVFSRLLELSSCALLIIKKHLEGVIDTNLKSIFFSEMEGFDIVIELHKEVVCFGSFGYNSGKEIISKLKKPTQESVLPIVNFNPPMKFLEELKVYFGNIALFFYDRYGGKSIGVLLRPDFKKAFGEYKVNRTYCRKNSKEGLTPNIEEFMETIKILGNGIVSNVMLN
uniref:Nucleolar protein 6 n=1 Tax=Panagrolaimus davidi TaxID=227884 RepID=A0A914P2N1_9BILA